MCFRLAAYRASQLRQRTYQLSRRIHMFCAWLYTAAPLILDSLLIS